jgi:hypothetical protein
VLLSELACCKVGWDGAFRAAHLNSVALRLLSELTARACCLVCLHGTGNWRSTRRHGAACASGRRLVAKTVSWSETGTICANKQVVGGEEETPCARRRVVVRGGDSSEKLSPSKRLVEEAPDWLETRRLPMMVLTRIVGLPYLES